LAQVRRGMLVYDPFVGTGSILIAAAHHGAMTLGADIDPRVISLGKVRDTTLTSSQRYPLALVMHHHVMLGGHTKTRNCDVALLVATHYIYDVIRRSTRLASL